MTAGIDDRPSAAAAMGSILATRESPKKSKIGLDIQNSLDID
jgi:hypothetical protein